MFSSDSSDDDDELMLLIAIEKEELAARGRTRHHGFVLGHMVIDRGTRKVLLGYYRTTLLSSQYMVIHCTIVGEAIFPTNTFVSFDVF